MDWLNTDQIFVDMTHKYLPFFCKFHIHPNWITLIALILSTLLPVFHSYKLYMVVFFSIIVRQICDNWDGPVARECKKTSKLGGFLDNLADIICLFAYIFILFTFVFPKNTLRIFTFTSIIILGYLIINFITFRTEFLFDHSVMKGYTTDSYYKNTIAFIVQNSLILNILIAISYILYIYTSHAK